MKSNVWDNLHTFYKDQDWINKPNIFAEQALQYIKEGAKILELGSGQGQDTRFFAENGMTVVSTDVSDSALEINKTKVPENLKGNIEIQKVDMTKELPFKDKGFDVVYAHLSFHYFELQKTKEILAEIYRVLKDDGLLIMLNNSVNDPEYGTGKKVEEGYFFIEDKMKRYFSMNSLRGLTNSMFNTVLLDELGETYKDGAKGIHNLIRFVGQKIPTKYTSQMAVPFTGAIIEREKNGETEVLIQTRWKPERDPVYSGTFEFPAGVLDKGYENVYDVLKREVFEETGLIVKTIKNDSKTQVFSLREDDAAFGFRPFCNVQQLKNGRPWIGFIFICEVEPSETKAQESEVKDIRWVKKSEIKELFEKTPSKLFTLEIPAWSYYFAEE